MIHRNLTEAAIAMVMNHDSMIKLYGCCLETSTPILVYELLPNGTLFQHLHGDLASSKCMKWIDCLRVATDATYALSYMHNALRKPVVHRGLAPFSCPLLQGTHLKDGLLGAPGYVDPEYTITHVVTEKCDVYSFGVLMLEMLTRKNPGRMIRGGRDLVEVFLSAVEKKCMIKMIDNGVLEQASRMRDQRPTMIEVVVQLRQIQDRKDLLRVCSHVGFALVDHSKVIAGP
ncbi:Wall-associated receptor kinase-like 3 [Bienertia sinuspersici]